MKNITDARSIYFSALLAGPERAIHGNSGGIEDSVAKYDEFLGTVLNNHFEKQIKLLAIKSKQGLSTKKKGFIDRPNGEKFIQLIDKNMTLYKARIHEYDTFVKSLDDKDNWEKKEVEISKLDMRLMESQAELDISATERSKKQETEQIVEKKKTRSEMLEQMSKSLLMGVPDIDYLQDEEACAILLNDNE